MLKSGSIVKWVKADYNDTFKQYGNELFGKAGTVVAVFEEEIFVRFDVFGGDIPKVKSTIIELNKNQVIELNGDQYWSGKFIVTSIVDDPYSDVKQYITEGKVYTLKNGKFTGDNGRVCSNYKYVSFEDLKKRFHDAWHTEIIEFKGFANDKGKDHNE